MLIRRPKVGEGGIEEFLADPNTQNLGSCLIDLPILVTAVLSKEAGEFSVDFPFDNFRPDCPNQEILRDFVKSSVSEVSERDHKVVMGGPVCVGPQAETQGKSHTLMLRKLGDAGGDACDDIDGGDNVDNDVGDEDRDGDKGFNFDRDSGSGEETLMPLFLRAAMVSY
jgi:hypothetical protein